MLRVTDIMTTDVVTVSPDLAVRDAMELFVSRHISGAPVVEGQRVVGVVSLTDLIALAASLPGVPPWREASMEAEPLEEAAGGDAGEDEEQLGSYFTEMWEDAGDDVAARGAVPTGPEWSALDEHTVGEAMTRDVCALSPDADIPRAAEYMQRKGIHRVVVLDDADRLTGILTTTDIARAVAAHQLSERRFVFGKPRVREDGSWW